MNIIASPVTLAVIAAIASTAWGAEGWRRLCRLLHMLQLDEYRPRHFARWLVNRPDRGDEQYAALGAIPPLLAAGIVLAGGPAWLVVLAIAIWGGAAFYVLRRSPSAPPKKALVWTAKAIILATLVVAQIATVAALAAVLAVRVGGFSGAAAGLSGGLALALALALALLPVWLILATYLVWPAQKLAEVVVLAAARRKLRRSRVQVIAITGSYGKTSTKEFTTTLLASRYQVLRTPESYNTPLGIARVILRQLQPEHDYFVIELGAYRPGEIRRLCQLVQPQIGVLTAIGPQHLERFGTIEAIAATKYELIESLPAHGVAIFNADDPRCRSLAARTDGRVVRYGLQEPPTQVGDVAAEQVRPLRRGMAFAIRDGGGPVQPVTVGVLGQPNVSNLLAAAAVAQACGLSLAEVAQAAQAIRPVAHRLEPLDGAGGVLVIDDAYNSNPVGAAAALEVLGQLPGRRKVLVTPGMIELGDRHEAEHRALGQQAASVCDTVILVGPRRTAPILGGLMEASFPRQQVLVVATLKEAMARLPTVVGRGDVVLFENDLPDTYEALG